MLGERTAEEIKMALGSAYPSVDEPHAEIRGRDLVTGLPKTVITTTQDIRRAIDEPVSAIVDAVKVTLDKTPPELAADDRPQGRLVGPGGDRGRQHVGDCGNSVRHTVHGMTMIRAGVAPTKLGRG